MSNKAYQEILEETNLIFDKTLPQEKLLQDWAAKLKKIKNIREAHTTVYRLYATYIKIVKNLEECYDQMLQPQKRIILRVLLDAAIGRMLELKDELVKLDMSDFNYDDDALAQLRVTPGDLELRVPRYIAREREAERLERKKVMDQIYLKLHPPEPTEEEKQKPEEEKGEEDIEVDEIVGMLHSKPESMHEIAPVTRLSQAPASVAAAEDVTSEEKPPEGEKPGDETKAEPDAEGAEVEGLKVPKIRETPQHRREMFAARAVEREKARQEIKKEAAERRIEEMRKAIFVIQVHERARQARYKHNFVHNVGVMHAEETQKRVSEYVKQQREYAAIKIQKCWRRHRERRKQRHREDQESQLLWMARKNGPLDRSQHNRAEEVCRLRYGPQDDFQEDYEYAQVREYEEYEERHAPWLKEQYQDEIRDWFREWYTQIRYFPPEFPKEEDGGSLLIVEGKTIKPRVWLMQHEKEEAEKSKKKKKEKENKPPKKTKEQIREEKKKAKELAAKLKKEEEKKRLQDEQDNPGFKMNESKYLPTLYDETEQYNETWRLKDESGNREQRHYVDIIQQEKQSLIQQNVRKMVDELMRLELQRLQTAVEKDIARRKGKKWKPKKGKKKKKKGKKGKKKGKRRPELTDGRSEESLIEELMEAGILVHPIPEIRIEQFNGDYHYTAYEKRLLMEDPVPAVADMKNLVHQYCILPFGSPLIRQTSPLVKAVCLVGPRDSGKHMLVNAICTETGAYLFDISPETIAGKYKGKEGTKMFDHLMNKMTRLLQPAVVFIDGAEKPFYKKVPKAERQFEPKRLARWLPKFAKKIKPVDQVMIVGTTNQPWAGSPKKLTKLYNKFIFIPKTDYGTIELVWQEQIMRNHLVNRKLDLSALAKTTAGLPVGVIKYLAQKVLTRRRILELPMKPLTPAEIFEACLKYEPVTDEEFKKFLDFFNKRTKLGKKRAKFLREYHEMQEQMDKLKKTKK